MTLWLIILITISGCDIPRDNPFDPKAYNYGIQNPIEPELPVLQITSFHSLQWFPFEDIYSMEILVSGASAETADSADLVYTDTVFFALNRSGSIWRQSLESSDFASENLFDLIGVQLYAYLYYGTNIVVATEGACLYRIIEDIPETVRPTGGELAPPAPELQWEPAEALFNFTYTLKINHYAASGFITEVAAIENIPRDSTSYQYSDSLAAGSYYWTIAIVDIYNNISRSREAAFTVAP
ncbi:MAG: hypothetical protein H8E87_00170 [FCB group bacterium]|nr:hypothetical protein [FCB group bacterium]